jgi:hypothetical protein
MNQFAIRIGKWAGFAIFGLYSAYTVSLSVSMLLGMPTNWTNLAEYLPRVSTGSLVAYTVTQLTVVLAGFMFLLLLGAIHEIAPADRRILTRFAMLLFTVTVTLSCFIYFVHFNTLRVFWTKGPFEGMDQFIEWNLDSVISFLGFLGWSIFAGLAVLAMIPAVDYQVGGKKLLVMSWLFGLSLFQKSTWWRSALSALRAISSRSFCYCLEMARR